MNDKEREYQQQRINQYDKLKDELKELERQLIAISNVNVGIYNVRLTSDKYVLCSADNSTKRIRQDVKLYIEVRLREEINDIKSRMEKI